LSLVEIGKMLREAREEQGISLDEVERATRIRVRYIAALEAGDGASMPGEVYLKGFLRNYAVFLGFDGWDLLKRLSNDSSDGAPGEGGCDPGLLQDRQDENKPLPIKKPRRATFLTVLAGVLLLTLGAVAIGFASLSGDPNWPQTAREVPSATSAPHVDGGGNADSGTPSPEDPVRDGEITQEEVAVSGGSIAKADDGAGDTSGGAAKADDGAAKVVDGAGDTGSSAAKVDDSRPEPVDASGEMKGERGAAGINGSRVEPVEALEPDPVVEGPIYVEDPKTKEEQETIIYRAKGDRLDVGIVANESSWIQINIDGADAAFAGTLQEGDSLGWEAQRLVKIRAGRPKVLRFTVNGQEIVSPTEDTRTFRIEKK